MTRPRHLLMRGAAALFLVVAGYGCSGSDGADGTNGNNGEDGTSCTVTDNGDGTVTISCEDGTEVTVSDGSDGASCTVVDNGDGTKTISCDDGTEVTVSDGSNGEDGQDVTIVANEACLVCHDSGDEFDVEAIHVGALDARIDPSSDVEILGVSVNTAGGGAVFSLTFAWSVGYYDAFGNKTTINPMRPRASNPAQLENVRFYVAKLVPGINGSADTWDEYAAGQRNVSGLVDNGDGTYTYTFTGSFGADYVASATHRAGMQVSGLDGFKVINPMYDWVPSGGTLLTHEVVAIESCNDCHGELGMHGGGRVDTKTCVMCHNENRPLVDMPVMIHKIHTAQMVDDHDFTEVTFPQDPRNCITCHSGGADADNWMDVPNRKACGSCHADVNFETGDGHLAGIQTTDANCSMCHNAANIALKHLTGDSTPGNPGVPTGASNITYELVEARVDAAGDLEVDFSILRDGTALDVLALPADLTTASSRPSFLVAYALPQGGIDAPADYNNLGNSAAQPSSYSLGTLLTDGNVTAVGSGVYTASIDGAYPAGATLRAVALQGYFQQTISGSNLARHAPSVVLGVTGDTGRRVVVDNESCANCHDQLSLHGGNRVFETAVCVMCHNPNLTSSGRAADPAGLPAETVAALGSDPLLFPEEPMNFKDLIHGAHSSSLRDRSFEFVRNRNGGLYYDFAEITFPGVLQNCETCHLPGTYEADLPAGVLPTTAFVSGDTRDDILAARDSMPNGTDLANSPLASTCYGCHASQAVEAHVESNGGIILEPRSMAGLGD